jgi:glycosyltransferase involved in cell wall biosynthesis
MPIHGEPPHLAAAVSSVVNQDFQFWELMLVLDRPTPELDKTIDQMVETDKRIRKIVSSGSGIVDALNTGLDSARTELIARLDSDDLMEPNRLSTQIDVLSRASNLVCVGSQMDYIDSDQNALGKTHYPISFKKIRKHLLYQNCLGHPAVMYRRQAVLEIGGYRKILTGVEDYDLWLRLSKSFEIENIDIPLTKYRISPNQYSKTFGTDYTILEDAARVDFLLDFIGNSSLTGANPHTLNSQVRLARIQSLTKHPIKVIVSFQGYLVSRIIRIVGTQKSKINKLLRVLPFAISLFLIAPNTFKDIVLEKIKGNTK